MKNISFPEIFKKTLAVILMAYFSIFSPIVALAQVNPPVSAPISIPIPLPTPTPTPTPSPTPTPTPSPSPIPKLYRTIFVNNYSVKSGENLNVSWNIPNASNTDYIQVLTTDGTNRSVGPNGISPSNNCNLNNVSGPNAINIGSCTFTSAVIADLGTFKLSYYDSNGTLLASSNPFHVQAASNGTFNASPNNIGIGSSVNLNWANIKNAHPKDYINYLNADTYTGGGTAHTYWPSNNCKWFTDSTTPKPSGSCSIESPYLTGNYKLVYRSGNVPVGQPAPILAVTNVVAVSQNTPKPDLTVDLKAVVDESSIGVGTTANANKKVTLTATVKNIGSSSATPSVTRISTDNINEYWRLGTNSLNPGVSQVLTITTYKTPGTYQFKAIADTDLQVNELKEDNNTASTTVVIPAAKPDLVVENIQVNDAKVGNKINTYVTIRNIGKSETGSVLLTTVIKTIQPNGQRLSDCMSQDTVNIAPKQTKTIKVGNINCATYQLSGWHTIEAFADFNSVLSESNENNNRGTTNVNVSQAVVQPVINSIRPSQLRIGQWFVIYGSNLGSSGKVNFYTTKQGAALGSAYIYYWSAGVVWAQVPKNLEANKEYGIQVRTSDGRDSSLIYRYISR